MSLLDLIKSALPEATIAQPIKNKDIVVKSKDRMLSKKLLETFLTKQNITYSSVFKKSKSSSLDVLSINGFNIDIIFKPIIAKGAGGLSFEKELETDLINYYNGVEYKDLKHEDVIKQLEKVIGINRNDRKKILHEGKLNQKRNLVFNGNNIIISGNAGAVLTDLTLANVSGSPNPIYISLKLSKSYYTLNASVIKYFLDKNTQTNINEYFGFDGQKMGGFGSEYACITSNPDYNRVSKNLESLLDQAVGHNVILVHKKSPNDVLVKDIGTKNSVSISNLSESSYVYPEVSVRKYANIKFAAKINDKQYKVNLQFRGTTATDIGPKYLRVLLER